MQDAPELIALVQELSRERKVMGGICHGATVLARAGLGIGHRMTGPLEEASAFIDRGAEYTGLPVEVDGLFVSGRDSEVSRAFAEAFVDVVFFPPS